MVVFCFHIELNNLFHFQIINDILQLYSYDLRIHIIHEERNVTSSLIWKHFGYLDEECLFLHYIKSPYTNGNEITEIYGEFDFNNTFYLRSSIDQVDYSRDWKDIQVLNIFQLCKTIYNTQKERKLLTLSNDDETECSKQFKLELCKEMNIQYSHIYFDCELIFNGENISDIIETDYLHINYSNNAITKIINTLKIKDKPFVDNSMISFSSMYEFSKFIIDISKKMIL